MAEGTKVSLLELWFGIAAGPITLALQFQANFFLVRWSCEMGTAAPLRIIGACAMAIAALGGWTAWRCWRIAGSEPAHEATGVLARIRFLALTGMILSAMFFLAIFAQFLTMFLIGVCQ